MLGKDSKKYSISLQKQGTPSVVVLEDFLMKNLLEKQIMILKSL